MPEPLTLGPEDNHSQTNTKFLRGNQNQSSPSGNLGRKSPTTSQTYRFDHHFTQQVINATGPMASPRMQKFIA